MVDIILSTYNGEKFLEEQLHSLFLQDFFDFSLIIRDDGSSDKTVNILNQYKTKYPDKIRIIKNNCNLGSTASFLSLLQYSESELILFCDQDDVWNTDKISSMVSYYKRVVVDDSKPSLIHSAVEVVNENLESMPKETYFFNKDKCGMEKNLVWQVFQNDVTGCVTMINAAMRDLICKKELNTMDIIQHDWFIANIAYLYNGKYFYPEKTIKYRQHSNNVISARRTPFLKRVFFKIRDGYTYPFYNQISEVLKVLDDRCDNQKRQLLVAFSNLQKKNKFIRIFWHIKNKFFREGSILFKIYQILCC